MTLLRLPAPIDPHVHLREPGYPHKENIDSGTAAALAGGFVAVLDMPNTNPPTNSAARLWNKIERAKRSARCAIGFYLGATNDQRPEQVCAAAAGAAGLKIYVNDTFGSLRIEDLGLLNGYIEQWPGPGPIVTHAEGLMLAAVLALSHYHQQPVHIAHVSRGSEIRLIKTAKQQGTPVTCEVTPHHLFLSQDDLPRLGQRGEVRPRLASKEDQQTLWAHLPWIDCFATDHAPHTLAEKDGENPPPGFPGLETALPLWLTAVQEGRLSMDALIERIHTNPQRIFRLPAMADSYTEIETGGSWQIGDYPFFTRAQWSPFAGRIVKARVWRTFLRGEIAYETGQVKANPGAGSILSPRQNAD